MPRFHVTYEVVTYESAENGEAEERGFCSPGGWHHDDAAPLSLRDAVSLVGCVEDSGSWFTETDGRTNYRTGAVETRSLHPPRNITAASYARLARLLRAYR